MSILVAIAEGVDARLAAYLLSGLDQDVVTAGTVAETEQRLNERSWSAMVLDTTLPDGSSFGVLETLGRVNYEGAVLMLSTTRTLATRVRALDEGADDYLVRPYEPAEFLARMRALLRRSRRRISRAEGNVVRVGAVELDVRAMEVSLPGKRRERLTPSEMRVLHYLMMHSQRVVNHEELATHVFGHGEAGASSANAIGVYMRRVRRKIEVDVGQPHYIVTVRGSGYRFNGNE